MWKCRLKQLRRNQKPSTKSPVDVSDTNSNLGTGPQFLGYCIEGCPGWVHRWLLEVLIVVRWYSSTSAFPVLGGCLVACARVWAPERVHILNIGSLVIPRVGTRLYCSSLCVGTGYDDGNQHTCSKHCDISTNCWYFMRNTIPGLGWEARFEYSTASQLVKISNNVTNNKTTRKYWSEKLWNRGFF